MKKFFIFIFTVLCFLISQSGFSSAEATALQNFDVAPAIVNAVNIDDSEIFLKSTEGEKYITSTNNFGQEVFSLLKRKNSFGHVPNNLTLQNKFIDKFFFSKFDNIISIKSHKISSYLAYEICTRAP
ncbi:MAG: hypothetical protein ACI37Q_02825 [Candidatus Gastranaerophilaceae bacterium]